MGLNSKVSDFGGVLEISSAQLASFFEKAALHQTNCQSKKSRHTLSLCVSKGQPGRCKSGNQTGGNFRMLGDVLPRADAAVQAQQSLPSEAHTACNNQHPFASVPTLSSSMVLRVSSG